MNIPNPYAEEREKSPGELAQEWAALFTMASLFFGLSFTAREKAAIPIVVGALMRERKKVDLDKLLNMAKRFLPDGDAG